MTFLFDENLPAQLATALQHLGKPVRHVTNVDVLGRGSPDEEIIAYAAQHGHVIVSRDLNFRKPHLKSIIFSRTVGVFGIGGGRRSLRFWEIVTLVIVRWEDIERYAQLKSPPFLVRVPRRGAIAAL